MNQIPLPILLELLGPDVVTCAVLLAAGLLIAFVTTVILPALPRRRTRPEAEDEPRTAPVVERASPRPASPMSQRHWARVAVALDASASRPAAIEALQHAAERQVDAVEFALQRLCTELAAFSGYARLRVASSAASWGAALPAVA